MFGDGDLIHLQAVARASLMSRFLTISTLLPESGCQTRTLPSFEPETICLFGATSTALTELVWPVSGSLVPFLLFHTLTVPSQDPDIMRPSSVSAKENTASL